MSKRARRIEARRKTLNERRQNTGPPINNNETDWRIAKTINEPWCWDKHLNPIHFSQYDNAVKLADWMGKQRWWREPAGPDRWSYANIYTHYVHLLAEQTITGYQFAQRIMQLMSNRIQEERF